MSSNLSVATGALRKRFLRPIKLSLLFSISGEALLLVVYGMLLYPQGPWVTKFLWTIVFCGLGMLGGMVLSAAGGLGGGLLLYTRRGQRLLERLGL